MALLFKKFPNAYVLLFEGKTRIGEGYQGIPYATTHTKQEINQSELFYPRHNLIQNNNNPSQLSNSR